MPTRPRRLPWLDRSGRLSWLKATTFCLLFLPGLWLAWRWQAASLGPRPLTELIHQLGLWAIRLLFLSLAISPARQLLRWPQLITIRRMLGVAAMAYALSHLLLYAADQSFDLGRIVTEIALRIYLTIGFVALLGLVLLGATSTDAMIRRLGRYWQPLHRLSYPIAILAIAHFFMQSKIDVSEPTWMAGLLIWLLGWRLLRRQGIAAGWGWAAGLGLIAALLTFLGEATYFALLTGVDPRLVLAANLSLVAGLRPGWDVLLAAALVTLASWLRTAAHGGRRPPLRTARVRG